VPQRLRRDANKKKGNSSAHRKDAENAKKKLLKNEKRIQEYVRIAILPLQNNKNFRVIQQFSLFAFKK